jgi:hypothetical protein
MTFTMTMDRNHKSSTVAVVVLVVLLVLPGVILSALLPGAITRALVPVFLVAAIIPLVVAAMMAPRGVEVNGGSLRITRNAWRPMIIPIREIAAVEEGPTLFAMRSVRLLGTGGFFGSYGLFWTRDVGRYRLYTTRCGPSVLLRRRQGLPIVIGLDEPGLLRRALAEQIPQAATT